MPYPSSGLKIVLHLTDLKCMHEQNPKLNYSIILLAHASAGKFPLTFNKIGPTEYS